MGRVERLPQAEVDYLNIWFWIAEASGNMDSADGILHRFDAALQMLSDHPRAGTERPEVFPGVRAWPVADYLLFYFPLGDGVKLVRVLHGSRDVPRAFGKQP